MAVPGYQEFMFPILKLLSDEQIKYKGEIFDELAQRFNLTQEQKEEKLPSSRTEPTYINRIGWAITYLKKAGLLESPTRAHFKITKEGRSIVDNNIISLNSKYLRKYDSFLEFQNLSNIHEPKKTANIEIEKEEQTPIEIILSNFEIIKKNICDDLLNKVIEQSPDFFEQLVVDLIVAMGYGGSIEDAGKATRRTNDEGIDGVVKEDKLGLDIIYIQAKRWQKRNIVGRPEIQKFVGALAGQGARKGIFITTSAFTKEAIDYKPRNDTSIILIDGQKLVDLMYEYNLGTSVEKCFEVKRLDNDYFE